MTISGVKQWLNGSPRLKSLIYWAISQPRGARPRWWVRAFVVPVTAKRGRRSRIRASVRRDIFPFNEFRLGRNSYIESFSVVNNGVGYVRVGDNTRIGIGNTVIGPVEIGDNVIIAQNVVFSGLNHTYTNIDLPISDQKVTVDPITVGDDCWIGAGSVVVAGVTIGRHCVVGGASVVTKDVPDYTVVAGNPARIIKRYDFENKCWVKVAK